jgi:hypothetical protein
MMLDDPTTVVYYLREMSQAGAQAHGAAAEDEEKTGPIRDLIFGLNTAVDALIALIEETAE